MSQTILDLDALMDTTLDNIPDTPDFLNPPAGFYCLQVPSAKIEKYKTKEGADSSRLRINYVVQTTYETTEPPVPDGTMFSNTYQATEDGLTYFKKQAKAILNVDNLTGVPLRDVLSSLAGVLFDAKITIRKSTNAKDGKEYENINVKPVYKE